MGIVTQFLLSYRSSAALTKLRKLPPDYAGENQEHDGPEYAAVCKVRARGLAERLKKDLHERTEQVEDKLKNHVKHILS